MHGNNAISVTHEGSIRKSLLVFVFRVLLWELSMMSTSAASVAIQNHYFQEKLRLHRGEIWGDNSGNLGDAGFGLGLSDALRLVKLASSIAVMTLEFRIVAQSRKSRP